MTIFSFSPYGFEGSLVTVEVDLRKGIPSVDIVGLADNTVKESRERMQAAIRNSGFEFPINRVLISLSPADLKKEGSGFDLAIALAVLQAKKLEALVVQGQDEVYKSHELFDKILIMGELELSGAVRSVRGVHAAAATALACGIKHCIVPMDNMEEAKEAGELEVFGAKTLCEAYEAIDNIKMFSKATQIDASNTIPQGSVVINDVLFPQSDDAQDFIDVVNQKELVRALQIAAAGGHNVLAFGPPGCGKTLSMRRFGQLLPLLSVEEAQAVTRIHSLAGILPQGQSLLRIPPFRAPHQTATIEGMCGGGKRCTPGEISLSHNGVLFMDEAAEFKTQVLQMLRVPLESHCVTLSRAGRSSTYPADFQLLMAVNPCPCGNFGVEGRFCTCSARAVENYWNKFGGPLLDRVDLRVKVPAIGEKCEGKSTQELRQDIANAIKIQRERGKKNAKLVPQEIEEICIMEDTAVEFLKNASVMYDLSARAIASCKKIARTIADMCNKETIQIEHMQEAVDYRKTTTNFTF